MLTIAGLEQDILNITSGKKQMLLLFLIII